MWQRICSGPLGRSGELGYVGKNLNVGRTKLVSFFCLQFQWISLSLIFSGDLLVFK